MDFQFKQVEQLPVLNQADFPPLPKLPEKSMLLPSFVEDEKKFEEDFLALGLVNASVQVGQWHPVSLSLLEDCLRRNPLMCLLTMRRVIKAMIRLILADNLSVIHYAEELYVVPTPQLAKSILANDRKLILRLADGSIQRA